MTLFDVDEAATTIRNQVSESPEYLNLILVEGGGRCDANVA